MAIFKTAYDTSACSGFRLRDLEDKIKAGIFSGALYRKELQINEGERFTLHLLEGGNSSADVIPFFNHPLPVKVEGVSVHGAVPREFAVDVRNFGKWYAPNETFIVRNNPEYSWNVKRAILNQLWLTERTEVLRDVSTIPAAVYASLISECIARRFALDPAEQATIAVVACYFYYCLFTDDAQFDEFEMNKVAGTIARVTRVPADKVFSIIDGMKVLHSLEELCTACREKTQSIRLDDFNVGVLIAICSGTWFGTNARENLAAGLEHIPTWIMIIMASLSEATFKRSVLAKLSVRFDKGGAGDNFVKSMDVLLGGHNVVQDQIARA